MEIKQIKERRCSLKGSSQSSVNIARKLHKPYKKKQTVKNLNAHFNTIINIYNHLFIEYKISQFTYNMK